jgi:RHS repeat-associated protein
VTGTNAGTTVDVNDAAGQLTAEIVPAGSDPDTGTRYLTADHLGSTRAVTDGSGNLVDRMDYFPFGQTVPSGQSFGNRNLLMGYGAASGVTLEFTGKETDGESGLDYFGARYFSGLQGRFTSPDPTPAGISMGDPQSWNLYSYVRNRPTGSVDSNGLWATPLHPEIIQIALGGILSAGEIQQLAARQYAMDGDQSPGGSYKHFMRSPGQTADEATEESWSFVSTRLLQATTMLGPNGELTSASLSSLGDAMHTLQDFTSPSHTDSSGMPFVWRGFVREGINLVGHWWGENSPDVNWSRFGMAVKLTMGAYIQADPEGAAKLGLTSENLDAEFATRMGNYVSSFYSFSQGYSGKPSELGVNSARLCALGNPAACARGIWDK